MNAEQLNAHDRHYEGQDMSILFTVLDQWDGCPSPPLDSELRELTLALWKQGLAIVPISQLSGDKPLTPDLVEGYGFVADEPGIFFLENEDDPLDMTVRLEQNLRHQDKWTLFIDGGEDSDDVRMPITGLNHLLAVLDEHGYEFYDEDEDQEGDEE